MKVCLNIFSWICKQMFCGGKIKEENEKDLTKLAYFENVFDFQNESFGVLATNLTSDLISKTSFSYFEKLKKRKRRKQE